MDIAELHRLQPADRRIKRLLQSIYTTLLVRITRVLLIALLSLCLSQAIACRSQEVSGPTRSGTATPTSTYLQDAEKVLGRPAVLPNYLPEGVNNTPSLTLNREHEELTLTYTP